MNRQVVMDAYIHNTFWVVFKIFNWVVASMNEQSFDENRLP